MTWNLSTGAARQLGIGKIEPNVNIIADTITFTANSIQDSANGLGSFGVGDFVFIIGPTNNGKELKVLTASNSELTFEAGSLTAAAAGAYTCLFKSEKGGSFQQVFRNGVLRLFTGARPSSADDAETGTMLCEITLNKGVFVAGQSENGLNVGVIGANGEIKRAIDPATGAVEKWEVDGVAAGTAGWGRWYANALETGVSTTAVRMDGVVSTSIGSDIVMANGRDIIVGAPVAITDVSVAISG